MFYKLCSCFFSSWVQQCCFSSMSTVFYSQHVTLQCHHAVRTYLFKYRVLLCIAAYSHLQFNWKRCWNHASQHFNTNHGERMACVDLKSKMSVRHAVYSFYAQSISFLFLQFKKTQVRLFESCELRSTLVVIFLAEVRLHPLGVFLCSLDQNSVHMFYTVIISGSKP